MQSWCICCSYYIPFPKSHYMTLCALSWSYNNPAFVAQNSLQIQLLLTRCFSPLKASCERSLLCTNAFSGKECNRQQLAVFWNKLQICMIHQNCSKEQHHTIHWQLAWADILSDFVCSPLEWSGERREQRVPQQHAQQNSLSHFLRIEQSSLTPCILHSKLLLTSSCLMKVWQDRMSIPIF